MEGFVELNADQIAALSANVKSGSYADALTEFDASGSQGVEVTAAFPGRKAAAVTAGLKNAQRKHSDKFGNIAVASQNDRVFLIRK